MTDTAPIAVLLVDDQPAMLWGLENLIDGEWPRMTVAGKASDRDGALDHVFPMRITPSVAPESAFSSTDSSGSSR